MKKAVLLISLLCLFKISFGQNSIGGTLGLSIPTGDLADGNSTGVGLTFCGKHYIQDNISIGGYIGYTRLPSSLSNTIGAVSFIPLCGSIEIYFGQTAWKPYLGLDAGLFVTTIEESRSESFTKTYFGIAPSAGLKYTYNSDIDLLANFKLNVVFSEIQVSYFGLNVGVLYNLPIGNSTATLPSPTK